SDDYLVTHALHTTHGRALAYATGIKAFNPKLHVVVLMGDGDSVTIGGNHFIHAARRNMDLTAIIVNNFNFGMTGGQFSGTTPSGAITQTSIYGNPERQLNISALAEVAGANYVARTTPYHVWEMKTNIKEALSKKGFSVVEIYSPCPTHFGKNNQMKEAKAMLHWLRDKGLPLEEYNRLSISERDGYFPIGKLVDRDEPDFNTRYEEIRVKAMAKKG
ncbi:MAG: thiamine pyrophosphate-dependent enzyme, partial [Syntrophales bacterium]|nr:thiamine pyrophosphate-dependent enzyme [Syntrophales bacterium]